MRQGGQQLSAPSEFEASASEFHNWRHIRLHGRDELAESLVLRSVSLGASGARVAIDAAVMESRAMDRRLSIAVVDSSGELLAFHRMDGAVLVSIASAIIKAKTVVRTSVASKVLEDMLRDGNLSVMLMPGTAAMGGGMPIVVEGAIIGGIAVSGDTVETDERACQAGIKAILSGLHAETSDPE
jgi:glc operon protein GlcG